MNDFNIVVIDDDEAVLALILKIAKERGLEVQVFANCQDAAEWLIANSQNVKIAVADNEMPGIAGSALLAQAKILNPGIVTVLMSLYARDTLPPGVDKFYEKSNSAAEGLLKFLQDILQG